MVCTSINLTKVQEYNYIVFLMSMLLQIENNLTDIFSISEIKWTCATWKLVFVYCVYARYFTDICLIF